MVGSSFAHRENPDGTTDSICRRCFATVCTSLWEAELDRAEHHHVCDPVALQQWDKYAKDQPPGRPKGSNS